MGSGDKTLKSLKNNSKQGIKDVPKGCLAIKVGSKEEEKHRFVVPVFYLNHPLFMQLLREAEEEYGFEQKELDDDDDNDI
ncbi:Auxin-responsive protein SAUR32 [Cardamine amara subsp. amara]|uniref:Auxin-responsive protein SAUR32 n=1 Tax=Cardamine amara subsp. amara TaxID=228776 RepID=A0ABD1B140_CARAN